MAVRNISIFFFVLLAYIVLLRFTSFGSSYSTALTADALFAVIVLIFFLSDFKKLKHLFLIKKPKLRVLGNIFIFAPVLAIIVHFTADFLNENVLNRTNSIYFNEFLGSPYPLLFCILSMAVFPAIFEEIAFRGILFEETRKLTKLKSTILITAILFTLLHLSLISVLWIFPLGVYFGYLRAKYNTIVYGMIGHFTYNTCIVLVQLAFTK